MRLRDYFQRLLRFCGGWCNWTSAQALNEDLNYIVAAYEGYMEAMEAIFGTGAKEGLPEVSKGRDGQPIKMTTNVFDISFGSSDQAPTVIRRK